MATSCSVLNGEGPKSRCRPLKRQKQGAVSRGPEPERGASSQTNEEACRGALVQRAACSRKKWLIPSFWKDSDIVDQLYGPVWNENPPSVVISYVLRQRHLVGAQCGGDRRAGHSRVPHGSRWECPSPAPAPVTCDPPHCSQRAATLALRRPSTARGSRPRPRGPRPTERPTCGRRPWACRSTRAGSRAAGAGAARTRPGPGLGGGQRRAASRRPGWPAVPPAGGAGDRASA